MKVCEAPECEMEFEPRRSTARFCSATCRQRARRASAATTAAAPATPLDHTSGLVASVRAELEQAGRAGTFYGQLAMQLAGRLADRDESGISSLSKELRIVMAAALEGAAPVPEEPETPSVVEDDEVERARRRREESRQAAGLA